MMGWLVVYVQSNRIVVQGMVALPHKHSHTQCTLICTHKQTRQTHLYVKMRGIDDGLAGGLCTKQSNCGARHGCSPPQTLTHTMHTHLHTQADAPNPPVREDERYQ